MASQSLQPFAFQIAVYLTLCYLFLRKFLNGTSCLVLVLAIISHVFQLIHVKLFLIVFIIICQGAPLGSYCRENLYSTMGL